MNWWREREITSRRIGLSLSHFWNHTYAEFLIALEAHRLDRNDRDIRDLNQSYQIAVFSNQKDCGGKLFKAELRRITGSAAKQPTLEEMQAAHERIVKRFGAVIV